MTMLAQTAHAAPTDSCSAHRAVLERAVADAPSNIDPPRGLRRLFPRDRSAAGLIRRYGLWPAIEHSYDRVTREFGPVQVEVSAEDGDGTEFVMITFLCNCVDFDHLFEFSSAIAEEERALIGKRHWYRLVTGVEPGPETEQSFES